MIRISVSVCVFWVRSDSAFLVAYFIGEQQKLDEVPIPEEQCQDDGPGDAQFGDRETVTYGEYRTAIVDDNDWRDEHADERHPVRSPGQSEVGWVPGVELRRVLERTESVVGTAGDDDDATSSPMNASTVSPVGRNGSWSNENTRTVEK